MGERDSGLKQEKVHQGTYIKYTWTKPNVVGSRVGGGVDGMGGNCREEMETTVLKQQ